MSPRIVRSMTKMALVIGSRATARTSVYAATSIDGGDANTLGVPETRSDGGGDFANGLHVLSVLAGGSSVQDDTMRARRIRDR
jgi:hypothetical protein